MKAIVVGILPQDKIRERVLAAARREYKPKPSEPKIWLTSMRSLAEVLSDENRALLFHFPTSVKKFYTSRDIPTAGYS